MTDVISHLRARIQNFQKSVSNRDQEVPLHTFPRLQRASTEAETHFDQAKVVPVPPKEKREIALRLFLNPESRKELADREWRLIYAVLIDRIGSEKQLLDDDRVFRLVEREVRERINSNRLTKRDWQALCISYFGYEAAEPENSQNWRQLRICIKDGYQLLRDPVRVKAWMRIVDENLELFGSGAGQQLGQQIFDGTVSDLTQLQTLAQIPAASWLWHNIIAVVLTRITELDEASFLSRLPALLTLMEINSKRHTNEILASCFTRYHSCHCHTQPQSRLMQLGLELWGNPQLKSEQNRWRHHVGKPVCEMVGAWLAKVDLQHFFSLLKGEGEVDQARLFYWLRYADQMSYTRIVMGQDAKEKRNGDFVKFREDNKGRFGYLKKEAGTMPADNAVIMQIGNYFFVEFSRTGNACYVYRANSGAFNPDEKILSLNFDLKQKSIAKARWTHNPRPSRPDAMDGWQRTYDNELKNLGITPKVQDDSQLWRPLASQDAFASQAISPRPEPQRRVMSAAMHSTKTVIKLGIKGINDFTLLLEQIGDNLQCYVDLREDDGSFHIELRQRHHRHEWLLRSSAFLPEQSDPLKFRRGGKTRATPKLVANTQLAASGDKDFMRLLARLGRNVNHFMDSNVDGFFHIELKERRTDHLVLLNREGYKIKLGKPFEFIKPEQAANSKPLTTATQPSDKDNSDFNFLLNLLGDNVQRYIDHREKGGAYHIVLKQNLSEHVLLLRKNGFVNKTNMMLEYWKK